MHRKVLKYMKFSKYNMLINNNGCFILYNSKNAAFVKMDKKEDIKSFQKLNENSLDLENPIVKALYNRGYIVDDNIDEYEEVKKEIENLYALRHKTLQLMIYVTEQCNFRCVYCCEKHVNKRFSDENWNNVFNFIETSVKNDGINLIKISFF